jgi:hypothetical protein
VIRYIDITDVVHCDPDWFAKLGWQGPVHSPGHVETRSAGKANEGEGPISVSNMVMKVRKRIASRDGTGLLPPVAGIVAFLLVRAVSLRSITVTPLSAG